MASGLRIVGRVILALVLAVALLLAVTLISFFVLGYTFGFSGHPAGPDLPSGCYAAYLAGAPVLALAAALWLVFAWRRRRTAASR